MRWSPCLALARCPVRKQGGMEGERSGLSGEWGRPCDLGGRFWSVSSHSQRSQCVGPGGYRVPTRGSPGSSHCPLRHDPQGQLHSLSPLPLPSPFSFSKFPFSRPELLKEWVLNIGRGNFKPKQHTVICSEHFRPECFSAFGNRKNLKQNAVPTVFAFQDAAQLVRESTDPAGGAAYADGRKEEVIPEVGRAECGLGRRTDSALEAPPPNAGGPTEQVLPPRPPQGTPVPGQPAGPAQPSDHSYALLDLDALKNKLFMTLRENEKLRKRLRAQRLAIQRLSGRLRAHRPGQLGSRAGLRLEPEMNRAARLSRPSLGARAMDPAVPPLTRQGTVRRARHTPATSGDV
uniref:THAP-type domain-containing protein n=1 Tax=Neovison vison TaxID=452646 RepID=A0A8C7ELG0_NEOVI